MIPVLAGIGDEAGRSLAEQVRALTGLGWDAIELRTVDGVPLAELDDRAFDDVVDTLDLAGLHTVCVDSRIGDRSTTITGDFGRDLDELRVLERRCAALGTRYVRIMSYPNDGLHEAEWERRVLRRVRELALRAEQYGLVLLHENCAGWAGEDPRRALDLVAESPGLRLLFDTGNGLTHGYRAVDVLPDLVELVDHVHVKDGLPGPKWTLPGRGDADIARCFDILAAAGYEGALSIEPHSGTGHGDIAGFAAAGRAVESLVSSRWPS